MFRDINPEIFGLIVAIIAPKRTGKSLTAIAIIKQWLTNADYVHSNMWMNFSKYKQLKDIDDIKNMGGYNILFIDELRRYADSRLSGSMKNRLISNLLADTGKQKLNFIFTDQLASAIDTRIRENVDIVLIPQYDVMTGICYVRGVSTMDEYFTLRYRGLLNAVPIMFCFKGSEYFDYYQTGEKIEDYVMKFKPEKYAKDYLNWARVYNPEKHLVKWVKLWNGIEAVGLSGAECSLLHSYIELKNLI